MDSLFRRKTKPGFCACAITFQTQSTPVRVRKVSLWKSVHLQCLGEECFIQKNVAGKNTTKYQASTVPSARNTIVGKLPTKGSGWTKETKKKKSTFNWRQVPNPQVMRKQKFSKLRPCKILYVHKLFPVDWKAWSRYYKWFQESIRNRFIDPKLMSFSDDTSFT